MQTPFIANPITALIALIVIGFIVKMVYGSLTGVSHRGDTSQGQASALATKKKMSGFQYVAVGACVVAGLVFVARSRHQYSAGTTSRDPAEIQEARSVDDNKVKTKKTKKVAISDLELPEWTRTEEKVIGSGVTPTIHFVVKSAQMTSEDRARQDALKRAAEQLTNRWREVYKDMPKKDAIPAKAIAQYSQRDGVAKKVIKEPGTAREYEMFEYYLLFEDSDEVREPITDSWRAAYVDQKTVDSAMGVGFLALLMGTVSLTLRIFLAAPGYRTKPTLAAGALGLSSVAYLMLLT